MGRGNGGGRGELAVEVVEERPRPWRQDWRSQDFWKHEKDMKIGTMNYILCLHISIVRAILRCILLYIIHTYIYKYIYIYIRATPGQSPGVAA